MFRVFLLSCIVAGLPLTLSAQDVKKRLFCTDEGAIQDVIEAYASGGLEKAGPILTAYNVEPDPVCFYEFLRLPDGDPVAFKVVVMKEMAGYGYTPVILEDGKTVFVFLIGSQTRGS